MDRSGAVLGALDGVLGDGYVAERLERPSRTIVRLEPARGMRDQGGPGLWVGGDVERLPFGDAAFDCAYATWAYFFPGFHDVRPGLAELDRVVRPGGIIAIVDNLGDDDLVRYTRFPTGTDVAFWRENSFTIAEIETEFAFESSADAGRLLGFYAGEPVASPIPLEVSFRVALATRPARTVESDV